MSSVVQLEPESLSRQQILFWKQISLVNYQKEFKHE